jgi:hypothetical protein
MRYSLKTINTSRYIVSFDNVSSHGLQFALIEANVKDPKAYNEESRFNTLLLDSIKLLPSDCSVNNFPQKMADAIQETMVERHKTYEHIFHVSYVGISLRENMVYVCTAGNSRVHLIENGKITEQTNDHNLAEEPYENFVPNSDPAIGDSYKYIETRQIVALEGKSERPPECFVWEANGDYSILIASYAFHIFQESDNYLHRFLAMDINNFRKNEGVIGGLLTRIDCSIR